MNTLIKNIESKVANLDKEISVLDQQLTEVLEKRHTLREQNNERGEQKLRELFSGFMSEAVVIKLHVSQIEFYLPLAKDGVVGVKEIFNLYLRKNYEYIDELPKVYLVKDIELSYYTTSTQSEFEMLRLIELGKLAQYLYHNESDIVEAVNENIIHYSTNPIISDLLDQENVLRKQIGNLKKEKATIITDEIRKQITSEEGITLDTPEFIDFKHNYSANVQWIKIDKISNSGQTVDVSFKTKWMMENDYPRNETETRVRYNNIIYPIINVVQKELEKK